MCNFISWIAVIDEKGEKHCLFLTDKDVFSSYGRQILKGTKDNDILGHGAVRAYYNLYYSFYKYAEEKEEMNFWEKKKFPPEIAKHLKSPETVLKTWGKILATGLRVDDAAYILINASQKWTRGRLRNLVFKIYVEGVGFEMLFGDINDSTYFWNHINFKERRILIKKIVQYSFRANEVYDAYTIFKNKKIRNLLTCGERLILIKKIAKNANAVEFCRALQCIQDLTENEKNC